jgi:hypothetical protein
MHQLSTTTNTAEHGMNKAKAFAVWTSPDFVDTGG